MLYFESIADPSSDNTLEFILSDFCFLSVGSNHKDRAEENSQKNKR